MAARNTSYHQQTEMKRTQRLREICKELPESCMDFFYNISQTTSAMTRLAYAYDLRLFFQYLIAEQPDFADTEPQSITIEQIGNITSRQLRDYQEYLTQYIRKTSENGNEVIVNNHELGIMRKLCSIRSFFDFLFRIHIYTTLILIYIKFTPYLHRICTKVCIFATESKQVAHKAQK